jgi:urease alpha subunit
MTGGSPLELISKSSLALGEMNEVLFDPIRQTAEKMKLRRHHLELQPRGYLQSRVRDWLDMESSRHNTNADDGGPVRSD